MSEAASTARSRSALPSLGQAIAPGTGANTADAPAEPRAHLAEVDISCRRPLTFFFAGGVVWLIIGTVFAMLASIKLHDPGFMGESAWLTFGRVRPAHLNAMVYGFASQVSIAVAIWLMCRLCRVPLMFPGLVIVAGAFWNIGVTMGIIGILAGHSTSIEWLEMPSYANPILFASYALIGIWVIITFRFRREKHLYITQYYVLAAALWFPWIYSVAHLMLVANPVRGTVQAAVNWWYAHNVLGLWFTPVGLGAIYYFIPKVIGRPIHSYYLSLLGFWSLALFYNWNGMHHLIGGPLPAWLITASIVASVMMVIPVTVTAINHHLTMVGHFHKLKYSPTLRFIVFGAMSYTIVSLQGVTTAWRSWNKYLHFSHHTVAHAHWGMYGFFTMVMFGAMYYILPRITRREWPSAMLISLHFWLTAFGITIYVVPLSIAGIYQGIALNNPNIPFVDVIKITIPWLQFRSISGVFITLGHIAFAINFVWILLRQRQPYVPPDPVIAKGTQDTASITP